MLPTHPFGATGHHSSRVIFGAAALGGMSPERAEATLDTAFAGGVNHIDTAAGYGASEDRLQPWLARHRSSVFLATKTGDRDASGARASLERSLERMGVDQVDLIQLHNLVEDEEWEVAFASGGAVEALAAARDEGLCRFIGVTGHGVRIPAMHLRSLDAFPFDSVLFPYNHAQLGVPGYRDDVESLIEVCQERNVAMQTIKSVARRRWQDDTVQFVLGRESLFLNSSSDARLLPAVLAAAASVEGTPTSEAMDADAQLHDISPLFDGSQLERI
jgi:aryl-alcohol dehydrogenase-like predicted oxidoreductase